MRLYKIMRFLLITLTIIVILFPFEIVFGQYKTPEASIKASKLEPIIQTSFSNHEMLLVTTDSGKFTYYFLYKKACGWTQPREGSSYTIKYEGGLKSRVVDLGKKRIMIMIIDTMKHEVSDYEGNPYKLFEFAINGTKIFAYIQNRIYISNIGYGDVFINGNKYVISDLFIP